MAAFPSFIMVERYHPNPNRISCDLQSQNVKEHHAFMQMQIGSLLNNLQMGGISHFCYYYFNCSYIKGTYVRRKRKIDYVVELLVDCSFFFPNPHWIFFFLAKHALIFKVFFTKKMPLPNVENNVCEKRQRKYILSQIEWSEGYVCLKEFLTCNLNCLSFLTHPRKLVWKILEFIIWNSFKLKFWILVFPKVPFFKINWKKFWVLLYWFLISIWNFEFEI